MFWRKKKSNKCEVQPLIKNSEEQHIGPYFTAHPTSLHIISEYEDDMTVCQELRVSLSPSDWSEFEKQGFYSQLIEWVCHLENCDFVDKPEGREVG
jgi:hypothetical protein